MPAPPTKSRIQQQLTEETAARKQAESELEASERMRLELQNEIDQLTAMQQASGMNFNPGKMRPYTAYSYAVEVQLGLGRTGKRLLHGGVAAGATYGVGKYAGIEAIQQNPVTSMAIATGVGFMGTAILDHMLIDRDERIKMKMAEFNSLPDSVKGSMAAAAVDTYLKGA